MFWNNILINCDIQIKKGVINMELTNLEVLVLDFLETECENECNCYDCGSESFCSELNEYFEKKFNDGDGGWCE